MNADPKREHVEQKTHTGILLCNVGTPDAPTSRAVRRYLKAFLSDPRVLRLPRLLRFMVLYGFILPFRPRKSAQAYRKIWRADGSPLRIILTQLAHTLETLLSTQYPLESIHVIPAMRYGEPSIKAALDYLRKKNVQRLLIFPLYPQYSSTTTASTFDAVTDAIKRWNCLPELHFIPHYFAESTYIKTLAHHIQQHRHPEHVLLFSFHGIPERYIKEGDPYFQQCCHTAKKLACALSLESQQWRLCFQSRIGFSAWLQPYTQQVLRNLPSQGIKKIDVVCPGFSIDCLETLEENALRHQDDFYQAGGESFHYIPALNSTAEHAICLHNIIEPLVTC